MFWTNYFALLIFCVVGRIVFSVELQASEKRTKPSERDHTENSLKKNSWQCYNSIRKCSEQLCIPPTVSLVITWALGNKAIHICGKRAWRHTWKRIEDKDMWVCTTYGSVWTGWSFFPETIFQNSSKNNLNPITRLQRGLSHNFSSIFCTGSVFQTTQNDCGAM